MSKSSNSKSPMKFFKRPTDISEKNLFGYTYITKNEVINLHVHKNCTIQITDNVRFYKKIFTDLKLDKQVRSCYN